ncbi:MAG: GGDEF domain-containing protein, partial [bacterium]
VLKQLAAILKEEAREIDRVGRYGGEEFMLLLPGTVLDAAVTFAERVRKRIESHTFTFPGGAIQRTASFGVAGWPHPKVEQCDDLVRTADDSLYVAKETGRNKVVRFDSDEFNAHQAGQDGNAPARPDFGASEDGRPTPAGS